MLRRPIYLGYSVIKNMGSVLIFSDTTGTCRLFVLPPGVLYFVLPRDNYNPGLFFYLKDNFGEPS